MSSKPARAAPQPSQVETFQGHSVEASDPEALRRALELALNYRGDVTIYRKAGVEPIEGYIFDCRTGKDHSDVMVRLIPRGSDERVTLAFSEIASLQFTGKDTASGKSFESWVKNYAHKKLKGETASIESEPLDLQ